MEEPVIFHVWFATKRRKWLLQGDLASAVEELLRQTAREKMIDHVHLLIRVTPPGLPEAMRMLKGASAYQVFRKFPELKLDAGTTSFWQARYGSKVVKPEVVASVRAYIRTQGKRVEKFDKR